MIAARLRSDVQCQMFLKGAESAAELDEIVKWAMTEGHRVAATFQTWR